MDAQIGFADALRRGFPRTVARYHEFRGRICQETLCDRISVTFDLRQRAPLELRKAQLGVYVATSERHVLHRQLFQQLWCGQFPAAGHYPQTIAFRPAAAIPAVDPHRPQSKPSSTVRSRWFDQSIAAAPLTLELKYQSYPCASFHTSSVISACLPARSCVLTCTRFVERTQLVRPMQRLEMWRTAKAAHARDHPIYIDRPDVLCYY